MEISEQGEAYSVGGSVSVKVILLGSSAWGFPGGTIVKNLPAHAGDPGSTSWRRKWQPTPVFLPGKSHGWRNLVGYTPWGHKESDMTEHAHTHTHTHTHIEVICKNMRCMDICLPYLKGLLFQ